MSRRLGLAVLALAGVFVSAYLYLYKIGVIGTMACGTGACETVQLSPQSRFLGFEVSLIGLGGYATLLGLALVAQQPRYAGRSWPLTALLILSGLALAFTAYLTYLELFVIHAICRWCVGSAVIVILLFGLTAIEHRSTGAAPG